MKKPRLIFKINRNNTAKIYIDGKWQKHVSKVQIEAKPFSHDIIFEQLVYDGNDHPKIEDNEIARVTKKFHFGESYNGRIQLERVLYPVQS